MFVKARKNVKTDEGIKLLPNIDMLKKRRRCCAKLPFIPQMSPLNFYSIRRIKISTKFSFLHITPVVRFQPERNPIFDTATSDIVFHLINFHEFGFWLVSLLTSGWASPWTMHTSIASCPSPEYTIGDSTVISGGSGKEKNLRKLNAVQWKLLIRLDVVQQKLSYLD